MLASIPLACQQDTGHVASAANLGFALKEACSLSGEHTARMADVVGWMGGRFQVVTKLHAIFRCQSNQSNAFGT